LVKFYLALKSNVIIPERRVLNQIVELIDINLQIHYLRNFKLRKNDFRIEIQIAV